jgi:hypothetical protein
MPALPFDVAAAALPWLRQISGARFLRGNGWNGVEGGH